MPSSRRKFSGRRLVPKNREQIEAKFASGESSAAYDEAVQPSLSGVAHDRFSLTSYDGHHSDDEEPVLVASKINLLPIDTAREDGDQSETAEFDATQQFRDTTVIPLSKESVASENKEEPSFGVVGVARTPGDMLSVARKSQNMTVAAVADELNLKVDIVQALEEDRHDDIPGATYARGYLRTYGRYLNIDDDLIAGWFTENENVGVETPSKITNTRSSATSGHRTRGLGAVMLVLVTVSIGSALWFGYQQDWFSRAIAENPGDSANRVRLGPEGDRPQSVSLDDQNEMAASETTTAESVSDPLDADTAQAVEVKETVLRANAAQEINFGSSENASAQPPSEPVDTRIETDAEPLGDTGTPAATSEQQSATTTDTASSAPVPAVENTTSESETAVSSSTAGEDNYKAVATGASNASEATVVLRGKSDSWVEVSDASGRKIFLDMVHTNETYNVVGKPPFRLLIGNAPGVDVEYEGFWVDVLGNTNDNNIARLILGQQSG